MVPGSGIDLSVIRKLRSRQFLRNGAKVDPFGGAKAHF